MASSPYGVRHTGANEDIIGDPLGATIRHGDPRARVRAGGASGYRSSVRPEFGTNTGRQGTFDPEDPGQAMQALARLQSLQQNYGSRLRPGFTGETGLAKNDSRGWSNMLNAQTEAQNIERILGGRDALGVEYGGSTGLPRLDQIPTTVWEEGQDAITVDDRGRGRYVTVPSLAGLERASGAAPRRQTPTRRR